MKALLLGFGDLGRRLAPRLIASGWDVAGLRRSPDRFPRVSMVAGDCRDKALLAKVIAGQDLLVVTLTPGKFNEEAYRSTYVDGATTLVEVVARSTHKPRHVLWVSSTSVYGQSAGEWVDESSPTHPQNWSGRTLLEAENIVASCSAPLTCVRFSGIYGPGRSRLMDQVRAGQVSPATPVRWSNRIHREDCAGVLHHLALTIQSQRPIHPIYIASDCEPAPLHEVQGWLASQLGVELNPLASGDAAHHSPQNDHTQSPRPPSNRRLKNDRLLATGYRFIYPNFREGYGALLSSEGIP